MAENETHQSISLKGQVAIVTGGGRGIGRAIVLALAEAGAAVAVVARTEEQLAETVSLTNSAGGQAIAYPADVTDQQAVEHAVAKVEQQMGSVDLLVANAGHGGLPGGPIWEANPDEWWRCIDVNLRGPFLCIRAVVPGMIARHRGRVVVTASGSGLKAGPYSSAYVVSKCAAIRLTENLAAETKEHGVSAFAITPGTVRTAMTEAAAESLADEKYLGGYFQKRLSEGNFAPPERAAELVAFLASGEADILSGSFISIKDDLSEMLSRAQEIQENELYTMRLKK